MAAEGALTEVASNKVFGGQQKIFSHDSKELGCKMNFGVYFPPQYESNKQLPVVYFLSGLTCNETNFIQKAGAQRYAAEYGLILVNPDTSPRGLNIPGDSDSWDFGVGAGFYINATQEPWKNNYKMFNYVTIELIQAIKENFGGADVQSIMGHSMGGHGAFICALKNPGLFSSVSAFSPITNPIQCPWGQNAFTGYLGPKETGKWEEWDATELAKVYNGPPLEIFIDQGTEDQFLKQNQLLPNNLLEAATPNTSLQTQMHMREGYDHSYFYISSFVGDHLAFHSKHLQKK